MRTRISGPASVAGNSYRAVALAVAIAACLPGIGLAAEQASPEEAMVSFNIPAGSLSAALEQFSVQSGMQLMYQDRLVEGKKSAGVRGVLSTSEALEEILKGAG